MKNSKTLPTTTAVYGTKLGDIPFTGGCVDASKWSWSELAKEQVLTVCNTTAYQVTYTPETAETFEINPVITPRSLTASGITVTLPASSYAYTGSAIEPAVTITDTEAVINDDYGISYINNTNPGTSGEGLRLESIRIKLVKNQ